MSELRTFLRLGGRALEVVETATVGRSSRCEIVIEDDRVSREHCRVEIRDDALILRDLGSRNGVEVNGRPVREEQELHHGDQVRVGGAVQLLVIRQPTAPREERPSAAETQPAEDGDPRAWGELVEAVLASSRRAMERGGPAAARASVGGLLATVREALLRAPDIDRDLVREAADLALAMGEGTGEARWLDRALGLYVSARLPIEGATAERVRHLVERAPATGPGLDDYVVAAERIAGVPGRARGELLAAARHRETGRAADALEALRDEVAAGVSAGGVAVSELEDAWTALMDGSWTVVDHFDRGGRRYVVACANPGDVRAERFDERERQAAALLATGATNKMIADTLSLSMSHAGRLVRSIKAKLGVDSRSEAVLLLRWAMADESGPR